MSGILDLDKLLKSMSPQLQSDEYVFCTVPQGDIAQYIALEPLGTFYESEGLTLIVLLEKAQQAGLAFEGKFKQITLQVHSSLEAVGLTAAVSAKLASAGISANVVAAYYHDHVFVPSEKANEALAALQTLSS